MTVTDNVASIADVGAPSAVPTLETVGVQMSFGGVHALRGVDLRIAPGEWRGLVGPNGSGKSTLLNVLTGVYLPQQGEVRLDGHDITRRTVRYRARRGVSRTFQHPQLARTLTIAENVEIGARLAPGGRRSSRTVRDGAAAALDSLGCTRYSRQLPDEVPYGIRKLAEIARAVAAAPSVVLLDEPAAGLSAEERDELRDALLAFRAARDGVTVCLVEHDVPFVSSLCERLLVLDAGVPLCEGTSADVLADPRVREAYLGLAAEPTTEED